MQTTIYLLRHAESYTNGSLTPRGKEQALSWVSPLLDLQIDVIYSSSYKRALETIRPFSVNSGIPIYKEADFRERKVSSQIIENYLQVLEFSWQDFKFKQPGCESAMECQNRVLAALQRVTTQNSGKRILICSHGNAICLILQHIETNFGFEKWKRLNTPDLLKLDSSHETLVWDKTFRVKFDFTNQFF